ncbi:diacylglycerol kinase accessory domain protein [Trichuris suis]|nr:diacylglycerol kinase accessory domain protein [Trichuris suis]
MRHHWVHRWTQEGKCLKCGKSFQSKLMGKEMIAITCSWCKASYHNKCKCFDIQLIEQPCDLGALKDVIIPASWINKIPCCRYPPNRRTFSSNASLRRRKRIRKDRIFFVRPIEAEPGTPPMFPLLIFVNIKSGGKKGKKLFEELCWLVNPRQVFELSCGKGPRFALEMYRKCLPRLRIVVCGGDGTVSWVFSCLDGMKIPSSRYPPIAIVPLGTGNDLSQTMGWGSTYFDESIAEVLSVIVHDSKIVKFDRWFIDVSPNSDIEKPADEEKAADSLPVNVMNNYFSIGVDAHIALQFHESRTAKPEIHKSRFKNRLVYGSIGTKDLFKRAWKDLSEYISLECDGIDHTGKIKELGLHCLLILNIPKYAGGTMPWGNQASNLVSLGLWAVNNSIPIPKISVPSYEDGRIEVVGFTAASLAALQVGGRGVRIAQCCYLRLATRKVIPVQVDGEPCKLAPSVITISLFCKVPMLKRISDKEAEHLSNLGLPTEYALPRNNPSSLWDDKTNCSCKVKVSYVAWSTYEKLKNKTAELCEHAKCIGNIDAEYDHDLEYLRPLVNAVLQQDKEAVAPEDWFYLDCSGQDEVYHVDRSYEVFTSVTDISELGGGILIVLIPHEATLAKQSSQSTDEQVNFIQNEMSGISVDNVRCMNSSGAQLPLNQSCFAEKLFNIYSTLDTNEWDVRMIFTDDFGLIKWFLLCTIRSSNDFGVSSP